MLDLEYDYFLEEDKIRQNKEEQKMEENPSSVEKQKNTDLEVLLFDMSPMEKCQRENTLGMTVTSGSVTIKKDANNLIGISIGGGAPLCPCLYIVQIFDNTAASRDGTLQSGDELVSVNGLSVKGKTKVEVAKMIQAAKDEVIINYNKLHADPQQGKSLDIVLKKMKHRLVENMSSSTADALGLSRAILCNDTLVKKLQELQHTELMYRGLVDHSKRVLQAHVELQQAIKAMGDVFAGLAVREPQPRASEAFRVFGEQHRSMEKFGQDMVKKVKPVLADMGTYLYKAIPDTRLTVKKYADAKFEYLAYCLKVKEMDDEECSYAALQEPLYRVETGNYEYRLILRCRQLARARFAKLRSDVLVKMELLDNKHVQSLGGHLTKLIKGLSEVHSKSLELLSGPALFPVEVDLSNSAFQYKSTTPVVQHEADEDEQEIENGEEVHEIEENLLSNLVDAGFDEITESDPLIPGLNRQQTEPNYDEMDNLTLLSSLNINGAPKDDTNGPLLPDLNE
ncbi:PRKCA-binding protein isoform X1 [Tribolium castaneum]|uniref:PRKCA-binding protein isoform X1 n=1 Tax=Tribolium castaneum TaxID=7070 RepID=UPI00077DB157|nr:PREDICTED: PRKCA-binding protein isoform X1 [Tribolium castaneum]|eukprot:XP_015833164.1 PREDICTED: PRKCA-binding protein isoform X1 [Tribolium castaneum]